MSQPILLRNESCEPEQAEKQMVCTPCKGAIVEGSTYFPVRSIRTGRKELITCSIDCQRSYAIKSGNLNKKARQESNALIDWDGLRAYLDDRKGSLERLVSTMEGIEDIGYCVEYGSHSHANVLCLKIWFLSPAKSGQTKAERKLIVLNRVQENKQSEFFSRIETVLSNFSDLSLSPMRHSFKGHMEWRLKPEYQKFKN